MVSTCIELPVKATAADWFGVMRAHNEIAAMPGEVVLDASKTLRVEPFGATVFGLALARREHDGLPSVSWVPPEDESCAAFLEEIAFPLALAGNSAQRKHAAEHDTLAMRQVYSLDPAYLAGLAGLLVSLVPGTTEEMSHLVQLCLNELVTNVRDHAHSAVGCSILARWYKEKENVRIAIADAGDTIPGALRQRPRYAHLGDRDLVHAAVMTEGVTSRLNGKYGGYGLKNIRAITTQRDGGLIVVSGRAKLEVRGTIKKPRARDTGAPGFKGTAIEIDFRPGIEVDVGGEEVF
jgi:hypothetical protein